MARLVLTGQKKQTVRPKPKRIPVNGDILDARMWTGKPYRSKQKFLCDAIIRETALVEIVAEGIWLSERKLNCNEIWKFAKDDGFNTPQDMIDWFNYQYGLPFEGMVIYWD